VITLTQIALDCVKNVRLIVNGHNNWLQTVLLLMT
jgi:hypothetical protein